MRPGKERDRISSITDVSAIAGAAQTSSGGGDETNGNRIPLSGLTEAQASARLVEYGPNRVEEERSHPLRRLFAKFWAPVPWMLEAAIVLQVALGKSAEATVIGVLLIVNAAISFAQEKRANDALALLRSRLTVQARALRDGGWRTLPAEMLVPGDFVHMRMGDLAPADIRLRMGNISVDKSMLTGESLPAETDPGSLVYAGSVVVGGEASGEVKATGGRTCFGKTAELVRTAASASHLQETIFAIVRWMVALDAMLVLALIVYADAVGLPFDVVAPFALILLVASVPAALPATFSLATALGARELAGHGVLVTRLSAIEEAAGMDVLASDKTGTLTENRLSLAVVHPLGRYDENALLRLAVLACDEATQDQLDLAILEAARSRAIDVRGYQLRRFTPFDPETKRSEAVVSEHGKDLRVVKGAPRAVASLVASETDVGAEVEQIAAQGCRVLALAAGADGKLELAGLLGFFDPPRTDSQAVVEELRHLGVRVVMVTGDGLATARSVARQVGIGERICPREDLDKDPTEPIAACDGFARVYPEDKLRLVQMLQRGGHIVAMTGDGVNDAPALKQAEVGIAVASAADVAKAAASLVLTNAGMGDIPAAVQSSRRIHQRMLTYTLNKIVKTLEIAVFLSLGVMLTGIFVVTPMLVVLLLFTNDFVTMSIATDRADFSPKPERWRVSALMKISSALAVPVIALSFAVFFAARDLLHLRVDQLQTLMFVMLVASGQGLVYLLRERRHFWASRPSRWMVVATVADVVVVSILATRGVLMSPIAPELVGAVFVLIVVFLAALDLLKVRLVERIGL